MQATAPRSKAGIRFAALTVLMPGLFAAAAFGQASPTLQRTAVSVGQQSPSAVMSATVWLELHNRAALDAAVKAMYTPGSPTYQKFGTMDDLKQFAPTDAEVAAVKKELAAHNLTVVGSDAQNLSIQIKGQTSDFESAFHTTVNQYKMKNGSMIRATTSAPAMGGAAARMIKAVSGISGMHPHNLRPVNPDTGVVVGKVKVNGAASPAGAAYSSNCLYQPKQIGLTTNGGLPAAAYYGVAYGAPNSNTALRTLAPCGYSPQDLYKLTGLNKAYSKGFTGKGQTIAIVDAYGSPTIKSDLDTFNSVYGLPAATSTNFKVLKPSPVTATDAGWAGETTLDVEYAHAVAPDANIVLVATPSNFDNDLQAGVLYIIENKLANIISNSYGETEYFNSVQGITSWDELCELGAFEGVSVNFSTGDDGDMFDTEGIVDVSVPADSPYATAVGGTSVAFSPIDGSTVQTGWGTNVTRLSTATAVSDPPLLEGFVFGAGGGTSLAFNLPSYQAALGGTGRQLPDVSAIADPYTGVEIIMTDAGEQFFEVIGGTSLASPVFSAEWALVQQKFGFGLGQAAPYIAQFANTAAITDVTPLSTAYSVQGAVADSKGTTYYSSDALGGSAAGSPFFGALYQGASGSYYDLTFGTDSSLPVKTGWDPVTGWGVLNMAAIFN